MSRLGYFFGGALAGAAGIVATALVYDKFSTEQSQVDERMAQWLKAESDASEMEEARGDAEEPIDATEENPEEANNPERIPFL